MLDLRERKKKPALLVLFKGIVYAAALTLSWNRPRFPIFLGRGNLAGGPVRTSTEIGVRGR